jgi:tetratricopeptide (TPR) repeat protein
MVGLASGFTLGFVVADLPALLDATVERLTESLGADAVGTIALATEDDDADLLDRLAAVAAPESVRVVAVSGVANLLDPHGEQPSRALGRMNFNRTTLAEACPKPLLLLLPTWAMRELAHGAPDLWSWRSGMYALIAGGKEVAELVAGLPVDGAADRRERGETRRVLRHLVDELADRDEPLALRALLRLGRVESLLGDYDAARERYQRGLDIATTLGDRTREADNLRGLADIARMQGDYAAARERYDRALNVATTLGDRAREADSLRGRGRVAAAQGERAEGRRHLRRAATLYRQLGQRNAEQHVKALLEGLEDGAPSG